MDQDWFAPEVAPESSPELTKPSETAPGVPTGDPAPAAETMEEKPEEWFAKPPTSTNKNEDDQNENWFSKPPAMKPEVGNSPPPKIVPPKDLPAQMSDKDEDSDNWFANGPDNPKTENNVSLAKSQPRKESYMYGYISKVIPTQDRMKSLHPVLSFIA